MTEERLNVLKDNTYYDQTGKQILVGDLLKATSLIFGTILIATKQTKAFIITEIVSLFIMYYSTNWMLHAIGINGIVIAHTFTYFMYLLVLVIYFRKTFR